MWFRISVVKMEIIMEKKIKSVAFILNNIKSIRYHFSVKNHMC
jgi:hypothetical protein